MNTIITNQIPTLKQYKNGGGDKIHEGNTLNVLGIAASMRPNSHSTIGLKMTLEEVKKYKSQTYLLDLRSFRLPLYNPNETSSNTDHNKNDSEVIERITTAVKWADVFVLSSPDYHGSMSGTMKNFLDYFWEDFAGKTFGYIVASHEKGLTVVNQMRTAIRQCYGWSMPYNISINGGKDFDSQGNLVNSGLVKRIKMLARDLVVYGRLIREQFLQDVLDPEISDTFASHYRDYYN